jgi:hypothetical protein
MNTATPTNPYPDVVPPAGASALDAWQDDVPQPYRIVLGADRTVTDHKLRVSTSALQWADGSVDDGRIEPPHIYVEDLNEGNLPNRDQARALAAVLLEAAAEVDGWVAR